MGITEAAIIVQLYYDCLHEQKMVGGGADSQNWEKRQRASSCLSVQPHGKNSASTGGIFMKIGIWLFFENLSGKLKVY